MSKVLDEVIMGKKKNELLAKALSECQTLNAQLIKKCSTQATVIQELEYDAGLLDQVCELLGVAK